MCVYKQQRGHTETYPPQLMGQTTAGDNDIHPQETNITPRGDSAQM